MYGNSGNGVSRILQYWKCSKTLEWSASLSMKIQNDMPTYIDSNFPVSCFLFFFLYPVLQIPVNAICKYEFSGLQFVKIPSSNSIQFRIEEVSGRRENNLTGEKWSTGPGMKDLSIRPNFLP